MGRRAHMSNLVLVVPGRERGDGPLEALDPANL